MIILMAAFAFIFSAIVSAQEPSAPNAPNMIKRTIHKTDTLEFGVGGSVVVTGAPVGSIKIEGWTRNEVEITAEIELNAMTEKDLEMLAAVTGFILDESIGKTGITSVGVHDKKYVKRAAGKKFPKHLYKLPFRIDYVIKVPQYSDLTVNGGDGRFELSGVSGAMVVNFLKTDARLELAGGGISGTFGSGTVDVVIPTRSWRGSFLDINLADGTMNVGLPSGLNSEFDASILRTGKINNTYEGLKPTKRKDVFTDVALTATSGSGGVSMKFVVGDGDINIFDTEQPR